MPRHDLIEFVKEQRFGITTSQNQTKTQILSWIDTNLMSPDFQKEELKKKIELLSGLYNDELNGLEKIVVDLLTRLSPNNTLKKTATIESFLQ